MITDEKTTEESAQFAIDAARFAKSEVTINLRKEIEYNGVKYSSLSFDFDKLTGDDSLAIEKELQSMGINLVVHAFSGEYLARMACKACSSPIGYDIFGIMSLRDFEKIRNAARNFLLASES